MEVGHRLEALLAAQVRVDGVALDRARPDDRDLDHEVVEVLRPRLRQRLHLGPALDLEDARPCRPPGASRRPPGTSSGSRSRSRQTAQSCSMSWSVSSIAASIPSPSRSSLMSLSVSTSRLSNWTTTRSSIVARSSGAMSMSGAAVTSIPPEWIESGAGSRRSGRRTRASAPSRSCRPSSRRGPAAAAPARRGRPRSGRRAAPWSARRACGGGSQWVGRPSLSVRRGGGSSWPLSGSTAPALHERRRRGVRSRSGLVARPAPGPQPGRRSPANRPARPRRRDGRPAGSRRDSGAVPRRRARVAVATPTAGSVAEPGERPRRVRVVRRRRLAPGRHLADERHPLLQLAHPVDEALRLGRPRPRSGLGRRPVARRVGRTRRTRRRPRGRAGP